MVLWALVVILAPPGLVKLVVSLCCVTADAGLHTVFVDPGEILWDEAALAPPCGDKKPEYLLRPFLLMWVFKIYLSRIEYCLSVISLEAWPELDWVSFP